ncbi:AarF/ABC1/UbiB kinase family protein [Cocleimonas sp. KMM 6892]|uniref:ABC1 kinase family protein n=1 Tax=unclassified Cocleimonas TaxID=2639732 RepID=UPI002DBFFDFE|nr:MULTISPECIES: AarF/ABC1/UbiB kinase family protein [unclassified Cocleimonas]MEB8431906.1 AarF/ABC1/UbiB kinase family protein [Cocleimonas sp. KMM 6892]MEC4715008.1 AarF/ABC1/UbiB kinase family protein [Cocleimonas sp. KMM 6895]MEC4744178.1 AarF/ABC1/UbiB kinase family protein [Cocleimonas sp. KMM 6896]
MADSGKNKTASVPTHRLSRFARLGSLATGVAGGMLAEGARQLAKGNRPNTRDMLLTPANAKRVADQLAQLRGAAMKVGQLLSMDTGDLLPEELTQILSRLRSDAKPMPFSQLTKILHDNWGEGWNKSFKQFSFEPIAAASIGQVHSAYTKDGRHLAFKIQYPGVRESISSDVDNVATLLRVSGLIPKEVDFKPLLDEAKIQLQLEADYALEGKWIQTYTKLLENESDYELPEYYPDYSTENILAMSFVGGDQVETLGQKINQEQRNRVVSLLMSLLFKEIFEFKLVQTDPNFANYQYDIESEKLILLDFGATREYSSKISSAYRSLMQGAIEENRDAMEQAATDIGFFQEFIQQPQREAVLDLFETACEPLTFNGEYDFGTSNLAKRIRESGMALSTQQNYWHTPPADALFLHRKLAGLYLLAAKLKARVNMHQLFLPYMDS